MQIIFDGIREAESYGRVIFLFLIPAFGFGWAFAKYIPLIKERTWLATSLSLPIGVIAISFIFFALFLLARVWSDILIIGSWSLFVLGLFAFILLFRQNLSWHLSIIYYIAFVFILIIRLAFLKDMLLPPYNDSPVHYMIVQDFLTPNLDAKSFYSVFGHYYHFGFHTLTAWLTILAGVRSPLLMALLGQILLAIIPFSVYGLTGTVAQDTVAAWVALLLAGFGWNAPAFAVNWGKFPTLAGIAIFPAILAILYLLWGKRNFSKTSLVLGFFLILGATFFHTRILICVIFALLSYALSLFFTGRLIKNGKILKITFLAISIILVFWMYREIFFQMYYSNYFVILVIVIFFSANAFQWFPRFFLATLFYLFSLGIVSKIPLPAFLHHYSYYLIDQPFVQISLFLPLSILGGLGLSGFFKTFAKHRYLKQGVTVAVSLIFIWNAIQFSYYPDACCMYVEDNDMIAYNWIRSNTPPNATFFIAGLESQNYIMSTDAGAWIQPLTGRETKKRSNQTSWLAPDVLNDSCQFEPVYIYVGGHYFSFDYIKRFEENSRFEQVFSKGQLHIYKIICSLDETLP